MTRRLPSLATGMLVAMVLLFVRPNVSYAQDIYVQIEKHQEQIERLEGEFITSQRRIAALPTVSPAQDLTFNQLEAIGQLLATANREFSVLTHSLMLASLVSEKRAIPHAKRIVETQKDYIAKRMRSAAEFTEKTLPRAKPPASR